MKRVCVCLAEAHVEQQGPEAGRRLEVAGSFAIRSEKPALGSVGSASGSDEHPASLQEKAESSKGSPLLVERKSVQHSLQNDEIVRPGLGGVCAFDCLWVAMRESEVEKNGLDAIEFAAFLVLEQL
jgi:hypothetical protein